MVVVANLSVLALAAKVLQPNTPLLYVTALEAELQTESPAPKKLVVEAVVEVRLVAKKLVVVAEVPVALVKKRLV